jgi:hypothetical protein
MRCTLVVLAAVLAAAVPSDPAARADAAGDRAVRVLPALVIRPAEASADCQLRWRSRPHRLSAKNDDTKTLLDGWLGPESGLTPDDVRKGMTMVYHAGDEGSLAIIGIAFRDDDHALKAEQRSSAQFATGTVHRFTRRGPLVAILGVGPPIRKECVQWMWEELDRRLAAAG